MKQKLLTLLLTLLTVAPAWALETMTVNGQSRTYLLHKPQNLPDNAPLVIACHGMNQSADWHNNNSKWAAVADTANFLLVFPNGINNAWDIGGTRDTNYVLAIIDKMAQDYNINRNRVYLTGFSMGGMFTYHCANMIPEHIAAFCPVSGYPMGEKKAVSSRPVPIMHFHGTGDDVCVFSGVQPTLDAWIDRNKCNTTPNVTNPYGHMNTKLSRWLDGLDGVEVALMAFDGKGHWQSEDPNFAITASEAWNFMNRWSLGPDAPKVTRIDPEDGSFDLPESGLTVNVDFNEKVEATGVTASLKSSKDECNLEVALSSNGGLTLTMPSDKTLIKGTYKLNIGNVKGENGGILKKFNATYVIGVEEVGEHLAIDTIFAPNWRAEQGLVGEGIPTGWYRIHHSSNGDKDEKGSGEANTGCARMKYFPQGGDFSEGFYLSARNFDRCDITYGKYDDHRLHLKEGEYTITFNSIFWNPGTMNANSKFEFAVNNLNGDPVHRFGNLPSSGNQDEDSSKPIVGSTSHELEFSITTEADYLINFAMTEGWNAVIFGNIMLCSATSAAERYKGTFLRYHAAAKSLYESIKDERGAEASVVELKRVIDKYEGFVSTSPTLYTAATNEIRAAMEAAVPGSGINEIAESIFPVSIEYYDLSGRRLMKAPKGISIKRVTYSDNTVHTRKCITR